MLYRIGNGNYLADGYFSSESQDSERWSYYRTRTEGQNTLLLDSQSQNVMAAATTAFGSTGEAQDALDYTPGVNSTAFFTMDMSTVYNNTNACRAIRFLNGRQQILLRDEITVPQTVQWRIQTNATIVLSNGNLTATMTLGNQTMMAYIQPGSDGVFSTQLPIRLPTDAPLYGGSENADQPNPGVTVLTVALGAGVQIIEVLFK